MKKLGILGTGKMGGTILDALLASCKYLPEEIAFYTPNLSHREKYQGLGLSLADNEEELFKSAEILLIAIKPQIFFDVLASARSIDFSGRCVISIAAGISLKLLGEFFPNAVLVRAMPNTPALIRQAATTMCYTRKGSLTDQAKSIFLTIGTVEEIEEEFMDYSIPLNGSMPAYLYLFAKSFIDKAVELKMDEKTAKRLCCQAILGSANMILSTEESIDTLIKNVCSPQGTTEAGLKELYQSGFREAIEKCFTACAERSRQLGK